MSSETKYTKHYTNNINITLLFIIVLVSFNLCGYASGPGKKDAYVIVLDPGHGGSDPGAIGSFSYERNITLTIALKTGAYLEQNLKNVKVVYTRKADQFVDLYVRSDIANKNSADLFISIHANANKSHNAYGAETYVMGHSKDEDNLEVAMKENQVILLEKDHATKYEGFDPKSPESYVMFSLMQNIYLKQSTELASIIQSQYKVQNSRFDRGVKQAGFWVLYKTSMPCVLTEIGFITNPTEEKYLNSQKGQEEIALAIYTACKNYLAEISKKSNYQTEPDESITSSQKDSVKASEESLKDKTVFMVQVVTSAKKIDIKPANFKGINDIVQLLSGSKFRYATGAFTDYSKALEYRKQIQKVYPDAYVIAVRNDKILPLREALDNKPKKK
jgi:N-acetylmuramoyl-L-alanine amidase